MPDSEAAKVLFNVNTIANGAQIVPEASFKILSNLVSLEISYQKSSQTGKKQVETLKLTNNPQIEKLDKALFDELTHLINNLDDFSLRLGEKVSPKSNESLPYLDVWIYRQLISLDLSANNISTMDSFYLNKLSNLTRLNLRSNQIESLCGFVFSGLNNLADLDLSENRLERIGRHVFFGLEKLKQLRLNGNKIGSIESDAFRPLKKLKQLWLYSNRIEYLTSDVFTGLYNLELLQLDSNLLASLEARVFCDLRSLMDLALSENRLKSIGNYSFRGIYVLTTLFRNSFILDTYIKECTLFFLCT